MLCGGQVTNFAKLIGGGNVSTTVASELAGLHPFFSVLPLPSPALAAARSMVRPFSLGEMFPEVSKDAVSINFPASYPRRRVSRLV